MTKQTVITKFFLTAAAVQVNPQFAADVILDAGVFLIVQSVQRPADNRVHLHQKKGFSMTKKKIFRNKFTNRKEKSGSI